MIEPGAQGLKCVVYIWAKVRSGGSAASEAIVARDLFECLQALVDLTRHVTHHCGTHVIDQGARVVTCCCQYASHNVTCQRCNYVLNLAREIAPTAIRAI